MEARPGSEAAAAGGPSPTMHLHDAPTAGTSVGRADTTSQPTDRVRGQGRSTTSEHEQARSGTGEPGSSGTGPVGAGHDQQQAVAGGVVVRAEPCAEVQAMYFVSDASSMRGGRSTRASQRSRTRTLPPRRADATRIPSVHRRPAGPNPGASRPLSDGDEVDEVPRANRAR
jgi:hypothetical protein